MLSTDKIIEGVRQSESDAFPQSLALFFLLRWEEGGLGIPAPTVQLVERLRTSRHLHSSPAQSGAFVLSIRVRGLMVSDDIGSRREVVPEESCITMPLLVI